MKVFIVDDYFDYAVPLKDRFGFEGHEAEYCMNSNIAVDVALKTKPDWLVLDIRMPFYTGVDVFKELKEKAKFLFSVVFYSNYCDDPDVRGELKNLNIPESVIIPKTDDLGSDVTDRLIPALKAGYLRGGRKDEG